MLLENKNIKLRALEPEDLDILYQWENDTSLWKYSRAVSPYSKLALRQYISDSLEMDIYQSKQLRLMIDLADGTTIGTIDLYDVDMRNHHAGIGILIDKNYRQNNYASQTLDLMQDYCFGMLKLHQLYAYIGVNNTASKQLFEKVGYQLSGVLRDWVSNLDNEFEDVLVMQLLNEKKK